MTELLLLILHRIIFVRVLLILTCNVTPPLESDCILVAERSPLLIRKKNQLYFHKS